MENGLRGGRNERKAVHARGLTQVAQTTVAVMERMSQYMQHASQLEGKEQRLG